MSRPIEQSVRFYVPIDKNSMWVNFGEAGELGFRAEKHGRGGTSRVRSLKIKPYRSSSMNRKQAELRSQVGKPPADYYQLAGSKNAIRHAVRILQAAHYFQQEDLY